MPYSFHWNHAGGTGYRSFDRIAIEMLWEFVLTEDMCRSDLRLHIGSGRTRLPGFINIDVIDDSDMRCDLDRERLPFADNSVDCIFSYHALEHFDNYLFVLGEFWRVLRHKGRMLIGVPYVTLTEYNLVNPYHKNHFSEYSFDFFDPDKLKGSANENNPIIFKKIWHRFHYLPEYKSCSEDELAYARRHLFNVVQKIDFGIYAIKPPATSIKFETDAEETLRAEFDAYLSSLQYR
jgi:SAM-dependent methyltransferase